MGQEQSMRIMEDSVLIEKIADLEKQVTRLKNSNWGLQKKLKTQEEQLADIKENMEAGKLAFEQAQQEIEQLKAELADHQTASDERFTSNENWIKKMFLWLIIILGILFLAVLILSVVNRRRINDDYLKLEAKVDNTKEMIDKQISDVLKRNEEDITALKTLIEKDKK